MESAHFRKHLKLLHYSCVFWLIRSCSCVFWRPGLTTRVSLATCNTVCCLTSNLLSLWFIYNKCSFNLAFDYFDWSAPLISWILDFDTRISSEVEPFLLLTFSGFTASLVNVCRITVSNLLKSSMLPHSSDLNHRWCGQTINPAKSEESFFLTSVSQHSLLMNDRTFCFNLWVQFAKLNRDRKYSSNVPCLILLGLW